MDPHGGYTHGAAISFLDAELRYSATRNEVFLKDLALLEITSLAPMGTFFKPVSWRVGTGFTREETPSGRRTIYYLDGGGGASFGLPSGGIAYGMIEPALKLGGGLKENYSLGGGLTLGLLLQATDSWKARFRLRGRAFGLGEIQRLYSAELDQTLRLSTNNSLRLHMRRERFDSDYSTGINISWNHYF